MLSWIIKLFPRAVLETELSRRNHQEEWIQLEIERQREVQRKMMTSLAITEGASFGGTPLPPAPPAIDVPILSADDVAELRRTACPTYIESDGEIRCHPWYVGQAVRCIEQPPIDPESDADIKVPTLGRRYIIEDINAEETDVPTLKLMGIIGYWNAARFEAE